MKPGEYSDTLRALGRYLESVWQASRITLVDHGSHVAVSWEGPHRREERNLSAEHLEEMRLAAHRFRGTGPGRPAHGTAERLRTVGRELDEQGLERVTIVEMEDGFQVTGRVKSNEVRQQHAYQDLDARSEAFHAARLAQQAGTSFG